MNNTTKFEAGIWEQGAGFVEWSRHASESLARKAARRYARRAGTTGGALTAAGGYRPVDGPVTWLDADGNQIAN